MKESDESSNDDSSVGLLKSDEKSSNKISKSPGSKTQSSTDDVTHRIPNKEIDHKTGESDTITSTKTNRHEITSTTNFDYIARESINSPYPPYTVIFKETECLTKGGDRKLIDHLISGWKNKNGNEPNITGRFGHERCLLIFTNEESTFDDLLNKQKWPAKINDMEFLLKVPRVLPPSYSLVIQQFFSSWDTDDVFDELQSLYPTLTKLTRIFSSNNQPLNLVRADFCSSTQVKNLLNDGRITIGHMKNAVKQYHPPVKINKCMKCYNHHHTTKECTQPMQLCIRCGKNHSFNNACRNEIKCINCGQDHYAGHSACPEVQRIRRQLSDDQKRRRAQLLINLEQDQHLHQNKDIPQPSSKPPANQQLQQQQHAKNLFYEPTFASVLQGPIQNQQHLSNTRHNQNLAHIENILTAFSNKIEQRLQQFEERLISQIMDIEKKAIHLQFSTSGLETLIYETILPAIKAIQDCSFINTRSLSTRDDLTKYKNEVAALLNKRNNIEENTNPSASSTIRVKAALKTSTKQTTASPHDSNE